MRKIIQKLLNIKHISYLIVIALGLTVAICLLDYYCRPWPISRRVSRTLRRWNIKATTTDEFPVLKRVHKNPQRKHELILELDGKGMDLVDMDKHLDHWRAGLNGKIRMDFGDSYSIIRLYLLPRRYVRPIPISIESVQLCREPNLLVVGKTGSGKSYALSVVLGIYARDPNVIIVICDYKMSSFAQFADTPNFYGYENVVDGIRYVYQEFAERLAANDAERNEKIWVLLIDEYGALVSAQDKKKADEIKTMVANMLFMGRSLGIRVLIGVQRADAEHFKAGARDQFTSILGMGNLSKEQRQMLFTDYKDCMTERNGLGEGYLLIEGHDIERAIVEPIKDMDAFNARIREAMSR